MAHSLFFLTGTRLPAEALNACLQAIVKREGASSPELRVGAETRVSTSPWTLWPVEAPNALLLEVSAALAETTTALSQQAGHEVIGLSLDPAREDARLCRAIPQQEPEVIFASRERVAATLASWLGIPAERMGVALGLIEAGTEDEEGPDNAQLEEEEFISRKLDEARSWMERWVAGSHKES